MNNIIETIHKRENRNNIIHTHNIKEIDYVVIDRPLNNICIQYKNGNFSGSKITNFKKRDLKKLEKLEKTDLDLEIEEMEG